MSWFNQSYRHYLAANGIKTSVSRPRRGRVYPLSLRDVSYVLSRYPAESRGLKEVSFKPPKDYQQANAYSQYVRGNREIRIFPVARQEYTPNLRQYLMKKVLPHELGHHVALYQKRITDSSVENAEARADALSPARNASVSEF